MTTATAKRHPAPRHHPRRRRPGPALVIGTIILVFAILAILVTLGGTRSSARETAPVQITGAHLPAMPDSGADPAIGMRAPVLSGTAFGGGTMTAGRAGTPYVLVFLAHWCPHCQRDVKDLSAWFARNGLPQGIDVYAVSTLVNRTRPNYPPHEWLAREGWQVKTMMDDDTSSAADAFGLTGTPLWVFVNGKGVVVQRVSGELGAQRAASMFAALART